MIIIRVMSVCYWLLLHISAAARVRARTKRSDTQRHAALKQKQNKRNGSTKDRQNPGPLRGAGETNVTPDVFKKIKSPNEQLISYFAFFVNE